MIHTPALLFPDDCVTQAALSELSEQDEQAVHPAIAFCIEHTLSSNRSTGQTCRWVQQVRREHLDLVQEQRLHADRQQADEELRVELHLHVRAVLLLLHQLFDAGGHGGVHGLFVLLGQLAQSRSSHAISRKDKGLRFENVCEILALGPVAPAVQICVGSERPRPRERVYVKSSTYTCRWRR